jgi:hypothetical protein
MSGVTAGRMGRVRVDGDPDSRCQPGRRKPKGSKTRGRDQCGQATKGVWGMSWRQEAMKGVEDCDKRGGAVNRALIPRSLNYLALNP